VKTLSYLLFITLVTRLALPARARDLRRVARRIGRPHDLRQSKHLLDVGTNCGKWCHIFEGRKTRGNHGSNICTFALYAK
jgi:hypothetical protein